jgi:hypothetical protein
MIPWSSHCINDPILAGRYKNCETHRACQKLKCPSKAKVLDGAAYETQQDIGNKSGVCFENRFKYHYAW